MIYIFGVLLGIVVFFLIILILLQESKGGGIAAIGGGAMDSFIGGKNPLRKITVIFSILFLVLVLAIGVTINRKTGSDNITEKTLSEESAPAKKVTDKKIVTKNENAAAQLPSKQTSVDENLKEKKKITDIVEKSKKTSEVKTSKVQEENNK